MCEEVVENPDSIVKLSLLVLARVQLQGKEIHLVSDGKESVGELPVPVFAVEGKASFQPHEMGPGDRLLCPHCQQ